MGLLTSNSKKNIDLFFKKHDLHEYLEFVNTSSSFLDKSSSIKKMIKNEGFEISECLYVGDEVRDIVSCQKLGIDILSVSYGFNSKHLLEEYDPNYIVDSVEEFKELIK